MLISVPGTNKPGTVPEPTHATAQHAMCLPFWDSSTNPDAILSSLPACSVEWLGAHYNSITAMEQAVAPTIVADVDTRIRAVEDHTPGGLRWGWCYRQCRLR